MNQTRVFLIFAWLMVATLLWMEWGKEQAAPTAQASAAAALPAGNGTAAVPGVAAVPGAVPSLPLTQAGSAQVSAAPTTAPTVTVTTDVLQVTLDGGELRAVSVRVRLPPGQIELPSAPLWFTATATDEPGLAASTESRFMRPL